MNQPPAVRPNPAPAEMRFVDIRPPRANTPLTELVVGNTQIDLSSKLQFIGLTWGAEDAMVTLGWAAIAEVLVVHGAQVLPLDGLALQFTGLTRLEIAFQGDQPGALEYFELQKGAEPSLLFYFEGGTVRLSARECSGNLLFEDDSEDESDDSPAAPIQ